MLFFVCRERNQDGGIIWVPEEYMDNKKIVCNKNQAIWSEHKDLVQIFSLKLLQILYQGCYWHMLLNYSVLNINCEQIF